MKTTTKKLFAALLCVAMMVPMIAIPTTAAAVLQPGDEFTVDFEDEVTIAADQSFSIADGKLTGLVAKNTAPTASIATEDENSYLVLDLKRAPQEEGTDPVFSEYQLIVNDFAAENYILSFEFNMMDEFTHYMGFQYRPDADLTKNRWFYQYGSVGDPANDPTGAWTNKFRTSGGVVDGLSTAKWYVLNLNRTGTSYMLTISEKETGNQIFSDSTAFSDITAATNPLFRFMLGQNNAADTSYRMAIDNFSMKQFNAVELPETGADVWKNNYVSENFDGLAVGPAGAVAGVNKDIGTTASLGAFKTYFTGQGTSEIVEEEDGNKYFKFSTAEGGNGYWIFPEGFTSDSYTVTLDAKFSGEPVGGKYMGFYFCYDTAQSSGASQLLWYKEKGLKLGEGNNFNLNFKPDTWYSFKITMNQGAVTFDVWDQGTLIATAKHVESTKNQFMNAHAPALRVMGGGTPNAEVCLDNITFHMSNNEVAAVAVQNSAIEHEKYAVRFIGTVDQVGYEKVGFKVLATYTENGTEKTKEFVMDTCTVYSAITANVTRGVDEYTAEELGGKYVYALSIYDIPASYANIKFEVTAIYYNAKGELCEGKTADCYAVVSDGVVTMADRLV